MPLGRNICLKAVRTSYESLAKRAAHSKKASLNQLRTSLGTCLYWWHKLPYMPHMCFKHCLIQVSQKHEVPCSSCSLMRSRRGLYECITQAPATPLGCCWSALYVHHWAAQVVINRLRVGLYESALQADPSVHCLSCGSLDDCCQGAVLSRHVER